MKNLGQQQRFWKFSDLLLSQSIFKEKLKQRIQNIKNGTQSNDPQSNDNSLKIKFTSLQ